MSQKKIQDLMKVSGRYEIELLPDMESYLKEQLENGTYDLDVNLAILKLYLLYPDEAKAEVYEGILLKALMAYPATDFALCMYQIPEKHQLQKGLEDAADLARFLETCKFKAFWKEAHQQVENAKEKPDTGLARAKGWETAVRKFVASVVSSTYRSIRCDQLAELLSLQAADLAPIIKENGWVKSKDDKDLIIVRENASFENTRSEPKERSTMSLEMYKKLFNASSSA
mmetsp:Transcript_93755/g.148027  ORF Transcript_93755/g.148027 Transcript_93755/m.148027 type:complete len:228 (+) Transcript_93755:75-758(+)|eukprot:CAMPEP_0169123222 /NCGR_PEP_ID=MMETSP1015-20121227/33668_1 /TAXON_ID=342587 /ORGANISM="Karlodinium micrum, Strain CCMP2283" /LENGTH=227 /DNA_ID=CAMNT_0009186541 /DNA_START=74 /DNA_END=757 /DNA_ORIENTATION=-